MEALQSPETLVNCRTNDVLLGKRALYKISSSYFLRLGYRTLHPCRLVPNSSLRFMSLWYILRFNQHIQYKISNGCMIDGLEGIWKESTVKTYIFYALPGWIRDSVVGIANSNGLDDRGVGVRIPVGSRILSSPDRPDRLWDPPNLLSNG
jgi:hypothetical protein